METARHRRTKSATAVEGNLQTQRQKAVPKLHSYSSTINKEDVLQNSLKKGSGIPIKKLLAEEMAKENEARRRQPSVIARLMGLDGLPSPQQGHKQQRRLLEKHQQRIGAIGIPQNEQRYDGQSCRVNSVDQQDFKDVHEDMEASHVMNHRCSSRWTANSRLPKPEMAYIQQMFMSRKCISSNDEFDDTLEILDSSKELLMKYLEQPDSLFLKHYQKLQDDPSSSPYGCMASLEPSNSAEQQGSAKVRKTTIDRSYRRDISSRRKRGDGLLLESQSHQGSRNCCSASKGQANVKDDINIIPTRIVVLKPNIGKRVNATCVSSPEYSHASLPSLRKRLPYTGSGTEDILPFGKKNSSREMCFPKPTSREGRNISKDITRQMTHHLRPSSALRGYAGDESSYDVYESDSSSASELMTSSSGNSFDGNNWVKHSSSGPFESLVSKEAKKRLSDRWKMTRKCQNMKSIAKGSTLGEMLAIPERDSVHLHFDAALVLDEAGERFAGDSDSSGWDGPQGISSKDGWKDGCTRTSSQARSLPPSSIGSRSCKTSGRRETRVNDVVKDKNKGKIKSRKGKLKKEGDCSEKNVKLSNARPHPSLSKSSDGGGSSPDASSSQIQADVNSYKEGQQECNFVHNPAPHITDSSRQFTADVPANVEPETLTLSFNSSTDLCPKHGDSLISLDDSSPHNQEDVTLEESALVKPKAESASSECQGAELESYESSKEADHCSPVSILEVSFAEDVSCSPDCFETVNAEINELRMKLQMLKMESGGCADIPMPFSSDEDAILQQPEKVFEEKHIVGGDGWKSSYVVDVLLYSGLEEFDPDTLDLASWHSPECPIGPWIFNSLEKKHNDEKTLLKFERRLLFDRMNSALLEMFQQYVNQFHWVHPITIGVPKWQKHGVKGYLHKLLIHQDNKVNRDRPENVLDTEMNWLGSGDSIDTIGKDIEELLIEDLIGEVVAM